MKFGYKEIKEFAENHEDERVQIMYRKLCETRSRTAKWCDAAIAAEAEVARLIEENKILRSGWCRESEKRQREWWNESAKTPVKWNTTTTGHTGCPVCNGLGSVENGIFTNYEPGKMPYQVQKWVKCKACQYYNE